ncbi:hypothetical protein DPMN_179584 [Dreissena polymorpha]|uniref:Uncharacterized protein n=1 Tax=Dreissena polymorpha TaxID=45954 RepID=A0A9D4IJP8_DREPO|nr:hypothetical protein DPMN_179584 [Dreissena polymorpha]
MIVFQGTSYAPPGFARPRSMGVGSAVGPVGGQAGSPNLGPAASGADQREVLTPPGGQPAGRSRPSPSPLKRHADRGRCALGLKWGIVARLANIDVPFSYAVFINALSLQ